MISFKVFDGDICGFIGPNGAGKTTMIRMITGLIEPTEGQIFINGIDVSKNREKALMETGAIVETPIFLITCQGERTYRILQGLTQT
ncbi:MAG: ATP-binding cassette domain-containing protein [Lachnotalea sp.]